MSANSSRLGLKVLVVLVLLGAAGAAAWFSFRPVARVTLVKSGGATNIVPGTVVVAPEKTLEIKSETDGRLIDSNLVPGATVKKDDILAQIDATAIDIDLKHYESELKALKDTIAANDAVGENNWKNTVEDFKEQEHQHEIQRLADVPFTRVQRTYEDAEQARKLANVSNAQKKENLEHTLELLQLQRGRTTIKAPFDGVVAQVFVHAGALIDNKEPLARLITVSRIVTGKISEENFAAIQVGQKATVKFLAYGDQTFNAVVSKKLPTAEEATQRYLIYLDVAIAPERLLPDLTGEVGVIVGEHQARALVPRRAIKDGCVLVVEDGRVVKRPVELGFTSLVDAEVTKGVQPGDQVIVESLDQFTEGDRVRTEVAK